MWPRLLLSALLLGPAPSSAMAGELVCDPDARVTFHSRWLWRSSVRLEGAHQLELPWTGREGLTSGHDLRVIARAAGPEVELPAELEDLRDANYYVTFRRKGDERRPVENILHIDRNLLLGKESDGMVIVQQDRELSITEPGAHSYLRIFRCRSR